MQATVSQLSSASAPLSDTQRVKQLQELARSNPAAASQDAWSLFQELQAGSNHYRLPGLFAQGAAPQAPDGDCEGIVMNLYGSPWLAGLDKMVRLGQKLGGIGWAGKTFDPKSGTGYNRLTRSSLIPARITMPHYSLRKQGRELLGFDFHHRIEPSPITPHQEVRAITYDDPQFKNPLVMPRVRDEIVEIAPDVYLGRALLKVKHGWEVVGYFGLRYPAKGGR